MRTITALFFMFFLSGCILGDDLETPEPEIYSISGDRAIIDDAGDVTISGKVFFSIQEQFDICAWVGSTDMMYQNFDCVHMLESGDFQINSGYNIYNNLYPGTPMYEFCVISDSFFDCPEWIE